MQPCFFFANIGMSILARLLPKIHGKAGRDENKKYLATSQNL